jgi:hypothetical protein
MAVFVLGGYGAGFSIAFFAKEYRSRNVPDVMKAIAPGECRLRPRRKFTHLEFPVVF